MTERFGAFRVLGPLGRGGMSETFVAEHDGPAGVVQRVCLKRLRTADANDPRWIAMFKGEARTVARLRHQNIVTLLSFGEERGTWWMALELVDGADLRVLVARERLPFELVLLITVELCKALAYAHRQGVVHRDVSPSNVLVSREGGVLLTDFGLAKALESERTRSREIKGKAPYISPEQALGRPVDGRADLFGLGVLMFELLSGQRPFEGKTAFAIQRNAIEGKRLPLVLAPDAPAEIAGIVDRLLQPEPADRFADADALMDALAPMGLAIGASRRLGARVPR